MSIIATSEELLLTRIAQLNPQPTAIDASNVIHGTPKAVGDRTSLAIRGIQDSAYAGQVAVVYDKLDLSVLFNGGYIPTVKALGQSDLHRLLPAINKTLGINLKPADVNNISLASLGTGEQVYMDITASDTSLAIKGTFRILFDRTYLQMADIFGSHELDIRHHPDPVAQGYVSAGLLTWGIDFSTISGLLAINTLGAYRRGNWSNYAGLAAALDSDFGIVNWPAINASQSAPDSVKHYLTKNLPSANSDYTHVAVQTNINSNGYVGTAYFHYNL